MLDQVEFSLTPPKKDVIIPSFKTLVLLFATSCDVRPLRFVLPKKRPLQRFLMLASFTQGKFDNIVRTGGVPLGVMEEIVLAEFCTMQRGVLNHLVIRNPTSESIALSLKLKGCVHRGKRPFGKPRYRRAAMINGLVLSLTDADYDYDNSGGVP